METIWHKAPCLRLTFPLIFGAFCGFYLPIDPVLIGLFVAGIVLGLSIIFLFISKWKYLKNQIVFGAILTTTFIFAGAGLSLQQRYNALPLLDLPSHGDYFTSEVLEYPQQKEKSVRLMLQINTIHNEGESVEHSEARVLAYAPNYMMLDTLIPGDVILFESKLQAHKIPSNPGQFDYGAYLKKNGIAGTVYFHKQVVANRPEGNTWSLFSVFADIQNYCVRTFAEAGLAPRELGVASALILGERSLVLPDTKEAFATAGAVHILAVSGLHVGIIYLFVFGFFSKVFPNKKWRMVNLILTILLLWIYAGITGLSPSVLRAATMFSFIAVGKHGGLRNNVYNMLAASAFVLVVLNPQIISEVGFQLSYLAVLGISIFYKPIYRIFIFKYWVTDKLWSLIVISFAAQLATFPLSIYYFSQFPNLFLITNLVVIPAATLALYAGLLFVILHIIPFVGALIGVILNWTLICLNDFIDWVSTLSFALSDNLHFGAGVVILVYFLIYSLIKFYRDPRKWNLWRPLLILMFLTSLWANRKIAVANTVGLNVLVGSNESLLLLQRGRSGVVLTNDTSATQKAKNHYFISGFCDKAGIDNLEWREYSSDFESPNLSVQSGLVSFNGLLIAYPFNEQRNHSYDELKPNYIVISNRQSDYKLELDDPKTMYIIDSSVPAYRRKQIIASFIENQIPFWDMHYQGAFLADKGISN